MASKLDELMALADRYVDSAADWEWGNPETEVAAASARSSLQSALKAVVEDAERYRWLRDDPSQNLDVWFFLKKRVLPSGPDDLDATIDSARKP